MKLNSIGNNQNEVEFSNGVTVFYSYQTPVAAFVPGRGGLATKQKYSRTTSNHVNQALSRWGTTRVDVEQSEIDKLAEGKGI